MPGELGAPAFGGLASRDNFNLKKGDSLKDKISKRYKYMRDF